MDKISKSYNSEILRKYFTLFCLGLLLTVERVRTTPRCVEILDAGLLPVVNGHIGIHFFVTVINRGPDPVEVEVGPVQCCEEFPGGVSECTHFHLVPELRMMPSNTTRNFTLIHPTMYPYDRRGECLLAVHYIASCNRTKEARQHITFDTSLREENVRSNTLQGFPAAAVVGPPCRFYDEDTLDGCKMVDCHMKYFGLKSFFNRASRMCEPVPACLPNKKKSAPDVIYDVSDNHCRDLSCFLDSEDLQHLAHADLEPECGPDSTHKMAFANCDYGRLSNISGECMCDSGYLAATPPATPRTQVIHSCNVDDNCWTLSRFFCTPPTRTVFYIALLLALMVVLGTYCSLQDL